MKQTEFELYKEIVLSHIIVLSEGKISPILAKTLVDTYCKPSDLQNEAIMHKDLSWVAQMLLRGVPFDN